MLAAKHKEWVLDTIDRLRQRKARPDLERISRMVHRLHGITTSETLASLDLLLAEGTVIKVHFKGNVSYRHVKEGKGGRGVPVHQVYDSSTRIIQAMRTLSKLNLRWGPQNEVGVTFKDLEKWLVDKNPDTRLVKHRLENAVKKVLNSGIMTEIAEKRYLLSESLRDQASDEKASSSGQACNPSVKAVQPKSSKEKSVEKSVSKLSKQKPERKSEGPLIDGKELNRDQLPSEILKSKREGEMKDLKQTKQRMENSSSRESVQADLKQKLLKQIENSPTTVKSQTTFNKTSDSESSSTSIPHAKRGRPPSKRKKFRKTHGPDFESPMSGKGRGMSNKEASKEDGEEEPVCDFCAGTQEANTDGEPESLLSCIDCSARAHPSCMNYTRVLARRALHSPWQCMDCKTCCVCDGSENADLLLFCDACDKGYHTTCHKPALTNKPKGTWVCSACKQAESIEGSAEGQATSTIHKDESTNRNMEEDDEAASFRNGRRQRLSRQKSEPGIKRQKRSPSADTSRTSMDWEDVGRNRPTAEWTLPTDRSDGVTGAACLPTPTASPRPADTFDYEMRMSMSGATFPVTEDRTLYSDASSWDIDQVYAFFSECGFAEQAAVFRDQEIDGTSLLLMKRNDVLTGMGLKLGPALKMYQKVVGLQKFSQSLV